MSGIKLFTHPFSYNATRVELVLAEKNVTDFESVVVDFWGSNSHKTPDFLSKSKWGQIPLLEDNDAGISVYESRAIARYLALKYVDTEPALMPGRQADIKEYASFEEAASVEAVKFDPYASRLSWLKVGAPMVGQPVDEVQITYNKDRLEKNLDVIDGILGSRKYMAGNAFSLVDIYYMPQLYVLHTTCDSVFIDSRHNLSRWWADVTSRASWKGVFGPLGAEWQEVVRKGKARQQE